MAKNIEAKMIDKLEPLLNKGEEVEYVVYGEIAPTTKKIVITGIFVIIAVVFGLAFIDIHWAWLMVIALAASLIAIELLYKDVYIGKFGKRVFLCQMNVFGKEELKEEVPLRCINYIEEKSDETHVTIQLNFDEQKDLIILRNKPRKKGLLKQEENIVRLEEDIFKKQRKKAK